MSLSKLQQAIALIQSGDEQGGQKLLVEVVLAEPRNEAAWFWLAAVAPQEKRVYCLEQVLSINPNNIQAQQFLAQLKVADPVMQISVRAWLQPDFSDLQDGVSARPHEIPAQVVAQPVSGVSAYWTVAVKKEVMVLLFQGAKLIMFNVIPDRVALVLSRVNQIAMTKEWFSENIALGSQSITYKSIPLNQVSRVRLFWDLITINYSDETGKNTSAKINCRKYKTSAAMMAAFQTRLGDGFERISKPLSRWVVAVVSALALFVTYLGTIFFYSLARKLAGEELQGRGMSVLIPAILKWLGPTGVGVIGIILLLLLLTIAALFFANPPLETTLVRKGTKGR